MQSIAIQTFHLTKSFGATRAISDLTLDLSAGMLHGVIGPDGAGKTTLLRLLTGLLHPDAGSIAYTDNGTAVPFSAVRPSLAYMPSRASLYPDLSIEEHLQFFKSLYRLPENLFREKREQLLSVTRLERFTQRKVGALSGGMYKKVGLMCALLQSPSVLLLDEPTNGVDPISRREFWELLYGLLDQHILIVIATAYMDEAERCSRVHLFDNGTLLHTGEPATLLRKEHAKTFDEIFLRLSNC